MYPKRCPHDTLVFTNKDIQTDAKGKAVVSQIPSEHDYILSYLHLYNKILKIKSLLTSQSKYMITCQLNVMDNTI